MWSKVRAMRHGRAVVGIALFGILSACAPSRYAGFEPVQRAVQDRTGYEVGWRAGAVDNQKYAAEIRRLMEGGLSADTAVRIALVNNRELQAAFEGVGIGLAEVAEATVLENPEIDAELRVPLGSGESGTALTFSGTQDLMSLVTLAGRRSAANSELDAARAEASSAVVDLVAEVRMAFYDAQAAAQILELRKTVLESLSAGHELAERIHAAGNLTDLALAQERARLDEGRLELAQAELEVSATRETLTALLGLSGEDTAWSLSDAKLALPPEVALETSQLERDAIARSLQLERERHHMQGAATRIGVARVGAWLPRLAVGGQAEREFDGAWSVGPAVSLSLPIFDRKQGARARGWAELRRAQHRYASAAVMIRAKARVARLNLTSSRARFVFVRDELVPTRTRVLQQTLLQYNAMNATPFELLAAKREEIDAAVEYVETLRAYWHAHAAVDRLRAGSTGEMP